MYNYITGALKVFLILVLVYGCAGSTIKYINPSANFSYIKKVAVLPLNNYSDDKYAGEKVRSALVIDLMSRHVFDVMEQGEVSKAMSLLFREEGAEEGRVVPMDKDTLKLLGEKLGVQAIIMGSVNEYSSSRGGAAANVISISVRMLDAASGTVLWQANTSETGGSAWRKVLGVEQVDMTLLATSAVRRLLNTLL